MTDFAVMTAWPIGSRAAQNGKHSLGRLPVPNRFTVVGYSHLPHCIRVVRDGCKTPLCIAVSFLEHLPDTGLATDVQAGSSNA